MLKRWFSHLDSEDGPSGSQRLIQEELEADSHVYLASIHFSTTQRVPRDKAWKKAWLACTMSTLAGGVALALTRCYAWDVVSGGILSVSACDACA